MTAPRGLSDTHTLVSVILVGFQSRDDLRECLPALAKSAAIAQEVILVDNASTDGTAEYVRQHHSDVRVIRSEENRGFAWACNRGAAEARGEVLVFLNCDTVPVPGWTAPLVEALRDASVGACMPRILMHGTSQVNTMGSCVHWSGLAWMDRWQEEDPGPGPEREVFGASGCALAIRADTFREVGGFTEDFFMYHEDVDLCWRLRMRGYRALVVPEAAIAHKYSFARNSLKWRMAERNRMRMILANYHWTTLVLLGPALVAADLALWAYATKAGLLGAKWRAAREVIAGMPEVLRRRKSIQAGRRARDRQIWRHFSGFCGLWRASRQYARAATDEGAGSRGRSDGRRQPHAGR